MGNEEENTPRANGGDSVKRSAPVDLASAEAVEKIHYTSLKVLAETGIKVLHDGARDIMKDAGAEVDQSSQTVRFSEQLIEHCLSTVPSHFTLYARNPEYNLEVGGDQLLFGLMGSAPNSSCMDRGRRTGNQKDYRDFLRLGQMHNILHFIGGYPVEPTDIIINTNSPLQLDIPMMQGIIDMASMNQMVVITPFTLSGAMAPVTIPGALVLQNAEALAGIAFSQMVKPGAPAMYGGFTSNVDMQSGAPAFGTPEYMKAQHIGGQLARRYNIPYRTSNVCAANTVDAQSAYESVFSLWGAINSGGHLLKHGAGWLEGGLCCSFEKLILDVDLLQMVAEFLTPLDFSEDELGLRAINDVGPGGHFFGTAHTQERFKDAFYSPILSDWRNFESWHEAGRPDAMQKANRVWKERLAIYEEPPIDTAIKSELEEFVAKRKEQGGVATDF